MFVTFLKSYIRIKKKNIRINMQAIYIHEGGYDFLTLIYIYIFC